MGEQLQQFDAETRQRIASLNAEFTNGHAVVDFPAPLPAVNPNFISTITPPRFVAALLVNEGIIDPSSVDAARDVLGPQSKEFAELEPDKQREFLRFLGSRAKKYVDHLEATVEKTHGSLYNKKLAHLKAFAGYAISYNSPLEEPEDDELSEAANNA